MHHEQNKLQTPEEIFDPPPAIQQEKPHLILPFQRACQRIRKAGTGCGIFKVFTDRRQAQLWEHHAPPVLSVPFADGHPKRFIDSGRKGKTPMSTDCYMIIWTS